MRSNCPHSGRRSRASPLVKGDRQRRSGRPLPGELNEKARMIETSDVLEPPAGQLERVAALAAAQIQDPVARRKGRRLHQHVDPLGSEAVVLDDVAVGAQVERAKQRTPPVGRDVARKIAERTRRADVPFNHLGCVSGWCRGKPFDFRLVDTASACESSSNQRPGRQRRARGIDDDGHGVRVSACGRRTQDPHIGPAASP